MDYSAVANEASPWGSSSPQASRSGFSEASEPESPTPIRHSHTPSQDSLPGPAIATTNDGGIIGEADGSIPGMPAEADPRVLAERIRESQSDETGAAAMGSQQQQRLPQHSAQRPTASRYHSSRQQKPVPQYKLQAKITALERTGRKDPVLRFDVYVCDMRSLLDCCLF